MKVISNMKTSHNQIYKLFIEKPTEKDLINYISVCRGYRKYYSRKVSYHVLPTSEGWQVHIDSGKFNGKHKVMKSNLSDKLLKELICQ